MVILHRNIGDSGRAVFLVFVVWAKYGSSVMQPRFLSCGNVRGSQRELLASSGARALALFFGGFSLLNLLGSFRLRGFDANLSWIDLRVFPEFPASLFLLLASLCLISFAIRP